MIALELGALLSSYLEGALYKFLNEWMNGSVCQLITANSSFQQPSSCHNTLFKDTSIDTIILSVYKCLCSEYLLVTKPRSFGFINSHALLKTHAVCNRFFASKSESFWTSRRRNIFNFKSPFVTRLAELLEIPVSRWISRDLLLPRLPINSDPEQC